LVRKLGCDYASTNFGFQQVEFDVVGYDAKRSVFHIVECKRSAKAAEIGHAFGQLLAYQSVLHNAGYEFLSAFFKRAHLKVDLESIIESVVIKRLSARFYVGLTERACESVELLELMKESLPNVGIIMVRLDGKCRDYIRINRQPNHKLCASQIVPVPIRRTFTFDRFLDHIAEILPHKLSNVRYANFKSSSILRTPYNSYRKFWFDRRGFHFEVLLRKSYLEIALHLESTKKLNLSMYRYFQKHSAAIRQALGKEAKIARWASPHWRRVYEHMQPYELTEDTAELVADTLGKYIDVLQPMVGEWEKNKPKS
jgi:hypothetical protein